MKCFSAILIFLAIGCVFNTHLKSTSKTKGDKCPEIIYLAKSAKLGQVEEKNPTDGAYPEEYQVGKEVVAKAKQQTKAARRLLGTLGTTTIQKNLIQTVHAGMKKVFNTLFDPLKNDKETMATKVFGNFNFNRQIKSPESSAPVWSEIDVSVTDVKQLKENTLDGTYKLLDLNMDSMKNVAGFLGLLGDIGTAIFDAEFGYDLNNSKLFAFENIFKAVEDSLFSANKNKGKGGDLHKLAQQGKSILGGDSIVDPNYTLDQKIKKVRRGMCKDKKDDKLFKSTPLRSGIFNTGEEVDKLNAGAYKEPLGKISWPYQTVSKAIMDNCNNEPFSGHFSGSIVEILFMLDAITESDPMTTISKWINLQKLDTTLKNDDRQAKAALASSFLIGIGYHSAVEILPTIKQYLGDPMWRGTAKKSPITYSVCQKDQNPTEYLSTLMTVKGRRRSNRRRTN